MWAGVLTVITVSGSVGYMLIEHWNWFDALYMTVITISTTGFKEVHPMSRWGEAFTMMLSLSGVFLIFGTVGLVAEAVMTDARSGRREARKMAKDVASLRDHVIVCGYGRVGTHVIRELDRDGKDLVVVDVRSDSLRRALDDGHLIVPGDGTSDEVLKKAGVERASVLITCIDSDAENVYVTLTARSLNPKLFIVGRAGNKEVAAKLMHAGADRAVSPYTMAGRRMVELALRPGVVDFIDAALSRGQLEFTMEELEVVANLAGRTVGELRARGIFTMAIQDSPGHYEPTPPDERVLLLGENLLVSGSSEIIHGLES